MTTSAVSLLAAAYAADPSPSLARALSLAVHREAVEACTRCPLSEGRRRAVPGEVALSSVAVVGEFPSVADEVSGRFMASDADGRMVSDAMGGAEFTRVPLVRCRPPYGRWEAMPDAAASVAACSEFTAFELAESTAWLVVLLGDAAVAAVSSSSVMERRLSGPWWGEFAGRGFLFVATWHPALARSSAVLRDEFKSDLARVGRLVIGDAVPPVVPSRIAASAAEFMSPTPWTSIRRSEFMAGLSRFGFAPVVLAEFGSVVVVRDVRVELPVGYRDRMRMTCDELVRLWGRVVSPVARAELEFVIPVRDMFDGEVVG